jgi:hypothetical protein
VGNATNPPSRKQVAASAIVASDAASSRVCRVMVSGTGMMAAIGGNLSALSVGERGWLRADRTR